MNKKEVIDMSMTLVIKGIFRNGKHRTVGTFSKVGVEYKCQFDKEDGLFLGRRVEDTYENTLISFNRCLELGKFKKLEMYVEGSFCNNSKEDHNKVFRINLDIENNKRVDWEKTISYVNEMILLELLTGEYTIPSALPPMCMRR